MRAMKRSTKLFIRSVFDFLFFALNVTVLIIGSPILVLTIIAAFLCGPATISAVISGVDALRNGE
jgi:hypothetical protein